MSQFGATVAHTMTQPKLRPSYRNAFSFCLAILFSICAVRWCLDSWEFQNGYFGSDNLYMLNTFSSLKSGTLSTFHFSHLPDFFPGAFTILPLLAVGVNWQIAYAAYSSFLLLVLVLSAHQVYAEIVQEHQDQAFSFLVIFFAAIVYFYPQLLVGLLQVGVHGGSFVVSVLCAVLAWKIISSDSKIAWTAIFGMALIVGVAAFSDILFICEFVAPLIVASFGLIFFRQYPLSRIILVLNVFVIAGTSAGVLILQRLPISPLPPHDLKELSRNIIRFFHTAPASSFVGVVVLFFVVFLFSGMCLPRDRVRLPRVLDFHVNLLPAGSNADLISVLLAIWTDRVAFRVGGFGN